MKKKLFVSVYCLTRLLLFITACVCIDFAIAMLDTVDIDFSYLTQTLKDWNTSPFIKIEVESTKCKPGWEHLFSYQWLGTREGCLVGE